MKERPILFSAPMVCALRDGTKTQTRRVVKRIPALGEPDDWCSRAGSYEFSRMAGNYRQFCPYGVPGERLWVKETFYHLDDFHGEDCTWYRADHDTFPGEWKPSIFMRRAYSRLTLEITAVRVERLQDISHLDARAEGVDDSAVEICGPCSPSPRALYRKLWDSINDGPGEKNLDGSVNPPRSWEANPWVWVIEFKRIPQTQPDVPATL